MMRFDEYMAETRRYLRADGRLDAGETVFFMRELAQILKENFDIKYAVLKGRQLVPLRTDIDPGAETFIYTQFDYAGVAKRITSASADFPEAQSKGLQYINPLVSYGSSFSYSIDELRAGAKVGRSIDMLRARAARRMLDMKMDDVLASGDASVDNSSGGAAAPMQGLINQSNTQTIAPALVGGSKIWIGNKNADQIIADFNAMVAQVPSNTKDVEHLRRVVLPVAQHQYIKSLPRSTISDTTVLTFLEDTNPEIEIVSWERLLGAVPGGAVANGSADRVIGYNPDPLNVFGAVAIEFEQMAPQLNNMAYKVNCRMKMGGVISPFPQSIIYMDGT